MRLLRRGLRNTAMCIPGGGLRRLRVTYHKVVDAGVEYRLVTAGGFTEAAEEVKKRLVERGFVVVRGSRGIGKSTLAAYVATTC
jgi:polynucleotide 5'-kinase involved in rRNA processing